MAGDDREYGDRPTARRPPPVDDTATVTGHTTPALTIRKGVGLERGRTVLPQVIVPPGTTVYYRITVTNTGNVALTGVTLSRQHVRPRRQGLHHPDDPGRRRSFDCDYSSVSTADTTTNIATADSAETPPATDTATVIPGGGGEQATPDPDRRQDQQRAGRPGRRQGR